MAPTDLRRPMQLRSIFYSLWLGALIGGVLVTLIRPVFYAGAPWLDLGETMRNTVAYVLPIVIAASFTVLPILVRYSKLHFTGFTCAGIVAGVILSLLHLAAHRTLGWFSDVDVTSIAYIFCSAVLVAWVISAVRSLAEFILLRCDAGG